MGLEAHAIDGGINFGHAKDLLDLFGQRRALGQVDRFAAETVRLLETLSVDVADDHDGRPQEMARGGTGQAHRPGPCDIDG